MGRSLGPRYISLNILSLLTISTILFLVTLTNSLNHSYIPLQPILNGNGTSHHNPQSSPPTDNESLLIGALRLCRMVAYDCFARATAVTSSQDHEAFSMRQDGIENGAGEDSKQFQLVVGRVQRCLKKKTLVALERLLHKDVIPVVDGIQLIRVDVEHEGGEDGGMLRGNVTAVHHRESKDGKISHISFTATDENNWKYLVMGRIARILQTHRLQIEMKPSVTVQSEGRGRRKNMIPMVMFAAVASAIIAIPMMFQFLSVLGGKALLLAKLALILTAIQGLKKIATSNVNYGLYHQPGGGGGGGGQPWQHFDRKYYFDMNLDNRPGFLGGNNDIPNTDPYGNVPERQYLPDYHQSMRPRSTVVTSIGD